MRLTIAIFVLFTAMSFAQVNVNLDQQATQWKLCIAQPGCTAGGSVPESASVNVVANPTEDATSLRLTEKGGAWGNSLNFRNVGPTTANYFKRELDVYIPSSSYAQMEALELDVFAYNAPFRFQFGTQCVKGQFWDGWNDLLGEWIPTAIPCNLTPGVTHHVEEWFHRDLLSSTACENKPCTYFDLLGVDHVYVVVGMKTPASELPAGWQNQSGVDTQIDLNALGGILTVYESHDNLTELGQ